MHESTVSLEICKIHTKGLGGRKETLNNQLLYNYVLIFDKSIFLRTNMVNITFFYFKAKLTTVPVVITTSLPPSTPVTSPTEKPPTTSALPTTVPQTPPTGL